MRSLSVVAALGATAIAVPAILVAQSRESAPTPADTRVTYRTPARTAWEYRIEPLNLDTPAERNRIGEDGWELVQVVDHRGIFKRPAAVRAKTASAVTIERAEDGVIILRGRKDEVERFAKELQSED